MKRHSLAALLAFVCVSFVSAQQKPNFSGTWVGVTPAEVAGNQQLVTHTATTLTLRHGAEGDDHVITYKLDGSESRNALASHGDEIVSIARASWEGDRLIINESTTYPDGRKAERRLTFGLDKEGQLVQGLTMTMTGQPERKIEAVYRKN
jgi:predicted metalloprotease with PDZ domain